MPTPIRLAEDTAQTFPESTARFYSCVSFGGFIAAMLILPYGHVYPPIYVMGFIAAVALAITGGILTAGWVFARARRLDRSTGTPTVLLFIVLLVAVINGVYLLRGTDTPYVPVLIVSLVVGGFAYMCELFTSFDKEEG